jgi:alpha-glucosidase
MNGTNVAHLFERIRFRGNPVAHPDAVLQVGNARFTVLTPRLIRLEWSATGEFEDRGTYAFPTRYTPHPPRFKVSTDVKTAILDTGALVLRHRPGGRLDPVNTSIAFTLDGETQTWRPGLPNPGNLRGTRRTLDECEGDAALDEGLLSRAGWALYDDSRHVLFEDGWVAPRPDHELQDWYFFGYGHDYKACLAEYTAFGGSVPLIPRFILGAWWSRYWAYSDQDLKHLVGEFEAHDVPLDVLVVDMDWHTPDAWTGYTWNRDLFPDPEGFLAWVHDKGLRATFNLHPAQGVQHFEAIYPRFAEAMGVDPETKAAVPFAITDKRFVENYFTLLHHPMEEQGVDFWWVDWQQGESSEMKGLDPLPWLNHLHFSDSRRRGTRPMLYSRWGGLGNHRCYIGFSGDTIVVWPALQFQPYMTATASNVAYGWWSHDIGGHMGGATEPELYARWVQFGALSPCLRLHSTKDPRAERRPWAYPPAVAHASMAAFRLRYQLVPYLYSMARVAADTAVSLCRPMYYEHPETDAAYAARYQYYLGDQAIAAPIVVPANPETGFAATDVWLPEGTWIDYQTHETYVGPRWVRLMGNLERVPLLIKAGGILPMAPQFSEQEAPLLASGTTDALPRDWLVLSVYPGANGVFRLYEDDGVSEAYREGQYEWTEVRTTLQDERTWSVEILPVEGRCDALPDERGYDVLLHGSHCPEVVMLEDDADQAGATADWEYNPETQTTIVHVPRRDKRRGCTVTAFAQRAIVALGEGSNRQLTEADVHRLLGQAVDTGDVQSVLRAAAGHPARCDVIARLGGPLVRFVEFTTPEEAAQQLGRVIVGAPADGTPYDLEVTWTLHRGSGTEQHRIEKRASTESHILDAPFAAGKTAQTAYWQADVSFTWHGEKVRESHTSAPLFPAITAWRGVVYDADQSPIPLERAMDEAGAPHPALDWRPYVQQIEGMRNLVQPHAVYFFHEYGHALREGKPLSGYLAVTVHSPDERQAALRFGSPGPTTLYLNGQALQVAPSKQESRASFYIPELQQTTPFGLRKGANWLLVDTRPPQEGRRIWAFGAAFTSPDGTQTMTDLAFD